MQKIVDFIKHDKIVYDKRKYDMEKLLKEINLKIKGLTENAQKIS